MCSSFFTLRKRRNGAHPNQFDEGLSEVELRIDGLRRVGRETHRLSPGCGDESRRTRRTGAHDHLER